MKSCLSIIVIALVLNLPLQAQKKKPTKPKPTATIDYSKLYDDKWYFYASASDGSDYYYNPNKMTRTKSIVRVWTESRRKKDDKAIGRSLDEIECGEKKWRTLAGVNYMQKITYGNERTEWELRARSDSWDTPKTEFRFIIPDSVMEGLADTICSM